VAEAQRAFVWDTNAVICSLLRATNVLKCGKDFLVPALAAGFFFGSAKDLPDGSWELK